MQSTSVQLNITQLLLIQKQNRYIYYLSAAVLSAERPLKTHLRPLAGAECIREMFAQIINVSTMDNSYTFSRDTVSHDYYPTSDQAEILVEGEISQRHITGVVFMTENDAVLYQDKLLIEGIEVGINADVFAKQRSEYNWTQEWING